MSHNQFRRLPPALAAATALRFASLGCNSRLKVAKADVDDILLRMANLKCLGLADTSTARCVVQRLRQKAPQLRLLPNTFPA